MKRLIALVLLAACNAPVAQGPQTALKAPESPEAPINVSCSPNCPRDLYAPYTAFEDVALQGSLVPSVNRAINAVWSLDGLSISWDTFNSGRVELSTEVGIETYYFTTNTPSLPFSAPQCLTRSLGGSCSMTMSAPVWSDDTTAQVTVCHTVSNVQYRCNTVEQAY